MLRATSAFLVTVAAALLITWGVSPAESRQARPALAQTSSIEFPPELAEVTEEVGRLTSRLTRVSDLDGPARDPFSFASRARPAREVRAPLADVVVAPAVSVRPTWPSLVAIMSRATDGAFEAALSDPADELHVVSVGASVGTFIVADITSEAVVLSDPASGQSTRLSMR